MAVKLTMIIFVKTSIFNTPLQSLVNPVNTVGVMGKGLAYQFRVKSPSMFMEYKKLCKRGFDIGDLHFYRWGDKIIINFPTKRHWKQKSNTHYIESGLKKFVSVYQKNGIESVSFPLLGCGYGGLDKDDVKEIMVDYLKTLNIPIWIHLY